MRHPLVSRATAHGRTPTSRAVASRSTCPAASCSPTPPRASTGARCCPRALRPGVFDTHKSTHSIGGIFGSGAAAACAAKLNSQQIRWVLDYTAQQSSGIAAWSRDTDHIEKGFTFGGMPARGGVTSALLVHSGWTGVDDIFSGENNFFLANAPHGDLNALIDRLGERFEIMRTSIKKWTVGVSIQAPLDALEAILKRRPLAPDQVREIVVRMDPRTSVVNDREMPDVNIQHMLAIMLVDRTATFAAAHDKKRMQESFEFCSKGEVRRAQLGAAATHAHAFRWLKHYGESNRRAWHGRKPDDAW